ncbi:NAD(P)-dependent alcohol dehydrogenase [Dyadobacter psychrotolerans]|uniref:NAD(P)-dependent alcohol dehydrogenase n=1 Tax=Dyadobacter psychrotolerans TaxID=2541721 RepID=A0A4R5DS29_9BACT|nr:NAD(P)-dependent alcohol dehydrogenase [Dyadobacter psychrotolerans]TDE14871.1 NAD(P)-dependent alcohol dehydrogenase [Dyadobacter psychrotolerans]
MEVKNIKAYGTEAAESELEALNIERRTVTAKDVEIEILFCGVCHSDLHQARNEWGGSVYPIVPGHEIVGKITAVGDQVTKFKVGQLAGVGCLVDSCRECEHCKDGLEQYCLVGGGYTYNGNDKFLNRQTFGGYSETIVVDENYVLSIPQNLDLAAAAPLLCAGITTYSPLKHWNVGPGQRVGVVGLGGLGHMGIKIAKAMGADVIVFTTSSSKFEDAKRLGADEVVLSSDASQMKKYAGSLHFVLDAVSAQHDINAYLQLLKLDGTIALVGLPEHELPIGAFNLVGMRRNFSGSSIGGIAETQQMLDFCAEHNIVSDIELINIQDINKAYERLLKGDVKYRFVIDMASLKAAV